MGNDINKTFVVGAKTYRSVKRLLSKKDRKELVRGIYENRNSVITIIVPEFKRYEPMYSKLLTELAFKGVGIMRYNDDFCGYVITKGEKVETWSELHYE